MIGSVSPQQTDISYAPGPTALKALLSTARARLLWGPVRSGKSSALCWAVFYKALEEAAKGNNLRAVLMRDTFRNLEDTLLKTWMEWLGPLGKIKRQQSVCDFIFNCTIEGVKIEAEVLFRHGQTASDASSFLSSEYGIIGLEECVPAFTPSGTISPGISEEVYDIGLTRLVQKGIENPQMILTCNPPTPNHWVNRRIIALDAAQLREANVAHFFIPGKENEQNLRTGYYDELRRTLAGKDHLIRRFVEGEVVSIHPGMPVFSNDFRQSLHVVSDLQPVKGKGLILGWDFGLTPACVVTQIDHKGRWLILAELQGGYVDDRLSEQIGIERFGQMVAQMIAEKFPEAKIEKSYADPNALNQKAQTDEKTCKQILEKVGFKNIVQGAVDITSRIEAIRGRLQTVVGGESACLISRQNCPLTIEALSGGYRYGVSRDASRVHGAEPLKDQFSHIVDALAYPASKLFKPSLMALANAHTPRPLPPSPMCY